MTPTIFRPGPGLVVRRGKQTYRFLKEIPGEDDRYVFVERLTEQRAELSLGELVDELLSGKLELVARANDEQWSTAYLQTYAEHCIRNLKEDELQQLEHRIGYVAAARRAGVHSLNRSAARALLEELDGFMPSPVDEEKVRDPRPPSPERLCWWLSLFEETGNTVLGLISLKAGRSRARGPTPGGTVVHRYAAVERCLRLGAQGVAVAEAPAQTSCLVRPVHD